MKNIKFFGKIFVIGIMILFFGASVLPSISGNEMSESKSPTLTNNQVQPLFEGSSYFVMLSDYTDGGGQDNLWAVQLRFDSALMIVECEFDAINLPLILDQWVEIRVDIDLDGDWMEIYYDGEFLHEKEWTAGPNNAMDGIRNIGAVDLFANAATSVYYDDMSLEETGVGVVWSEDFDSYADGSSMHGQGGWKGWDNDPTWTAYVSSAKSLSNVDIKADADLVHEYDGYTTGDYTYTAWQYIPSDMGDPPGAPDIDGPSSGAAGTSYDYDFTAIDPDGDDVKYYIDWGDETNEWTGFEASGTPLTVSHTWAEEGDYTITAYAQDSNGMDGPEGTLPITMPVNQQVPQKYLRAKLSTCGLYNDLLNISL